MRARLRAALWMLAVVPAAACASAPPKAVSVYLSLGSRQCQDGGRTLAEVQKVLRDAGVEVLASGRGEFINGSRLVYPRSKTAMPWLNTLANKIFALLFSFLLEQPLKDTLCGTKVLWRQDYQRIAQGRAYFGEFDPFGDFDLLFGAAKLNLQIVEVPIRYQPRSYGQSNIAHVREGLVLLRMALYAGQKLKFW